MSDVRMQMHSQMMCFYRTLQELNSRYDGPNGFREYTSAVDAAATAVFTTAMEEVQRAEQVAEKYHALIEEWEESHR